MGHEQNISCSVCKTKVQRKSEKNGIIHFACQCGKTTYNRSKGL